MFNVLKKNKKYLILALIIVLIGLVCGFLYYLIQSKSIKDILVYTLNNNHNYRYNAIFKDLIIMSLLLVSSFIVIGIPLSIFYLFYEGVSLGFIISAFMATYKLKGLFYIIIYSIVNKLVTLILIIFFIKYLINISRFTIGFLIYKRDLVIKEKIINNFIYSLYLIIIVFIINIILYFISASLFNNFLI